jgi:hypothetical protein
MMACLYTENYFYNRKVVTIKRKRSSDGSQTEAEEVPQALLLNTKLYMIADKYNIPDLKSLAARKFEEVLPDEVKTPSLSVSLALLFTQSS